MSDRDLFDDLRIQRQIDEITSRGIPYYSVWARDVLQPYLDVQMVDTDTVSFPDRRERTRDSVRDHIRHLCIEGIDAAMAHNTTAARRCAFGIGLCAWLVGDNTLHMFAMDNRSWPMFGMPIFEMASKLYNLGIHLEVPEQNMANHMPCSVSCSDGCI